MWIGAVPGGVRTADSSLGCRKPWALVEMADHLLAPAETLRQWDPDVLTRSTIRNLGHPAPLQTAVFLLKDVTHCPPRLGQLADVSSTLSRWQVGGVATFL